MRRSGPHEPTDEEIKNAFSSQTPAPHMMDTGSVKPMEDTSILPSLAPARDEVKILAKIKALAAAAGSDWFYSFPVTNHATGQKSSVEGATIKCANNVARIFGNCIADCRLGYETSDAWVFYARFVDRETGFALVRAFQQRKGQGAMKTKDVGRALDMVFQIGQSKAIRNVICNALETFTNFAFEEAKNSLVDRIGAKLGESIEWAKKKLAELEVSLERVQAVRGRTAQQWTAHDVALIYAELQAVFDGMSHADDLWPPKEPPVGATETKTAEDVSKSNKDLEGTAEKDAALAKERREAEAAARDKPAAETKAQAEPEADKPKETKPRARAKKDAAPAPETEAKPAQPEQETKPAEAQTRGPTEPADDEPRKDRYVGPPGTWADKSFIPLLRRMGTVEHVDLLLRLNEQNLMFIRKVDGDAHERISQAISDHRRDLVDASQ